MESGLNLPACQAEPSTSRPDIRPAAASNRKRRNSGKFQAVHFKDSVLLTQKVLTPEAELDPLTLKEMDSFLSHLLETFGKELKRMGKMRKGKTLSIRELETVTKLCLPKLLGDSALAYGRRAIEMYKSPQEELDEEEMEYN